MTQLGNIESIVSRLRFRHMRVLIALHEAGSMHRAADDLSMTQPGVTKTLHEIESALGATLFERSTRGVQATAIGQRVVRYAHILYAELNQMSAEIRAVEAGQGSVVSLGAVAGAMPGIVVRAVTRVRQAHHRLMVCVKEGTSEALLADLGQGALDLAICRTSVSAHRDIFDSTPLGEEYVTVVAGPNSPLTKRPVTQLAELAAYRWIVFPSSMPLRRLLERELMEEGLDMPLYPIETASTFVTVLMLDEDPCLVGLVSRETAEFFARRGMLVILPIEIKARTEPYELVMRKGYPLTPPMRLLVEELRREMR
ncbi:LysR family transcriptional regulator [Bordetella sp. FB-8]|uniref:LysR family transcriptional regulator n=1 Tax=Bordetella sp. FB-8 TaxID=1159870 RepID=UPI0003A939D7|nr:LysR family transcriptional regulator [Bordetella sp. FB-8]